MHYLVLTFSLVLHYVYRYICVINVFIYVYGQLSAIKDLLLLLLYYSKLPVIIKALLQVQLK